MMDVLRRGWMLLRKYPSVSIPLFVVLALVGFSIYAMVSFPLSEAVELWNGPREIWRYTPQYAQPVWTNLFRRNRLPKSLALKIGDFESATVALTDRSWRQTTLVTFDYHYPRLPSEIRLYYDVQFGDKTPILGFTWIKPDGTEIELSRSMARGGSSLLVIDPQEVFEDTQADGPGSNPNERTKKSDVIAAEGRYALRIDALTFEEERFSIDGTLHIYGRVYGLCGTDDQRRDLWIALLWGAPVALMFGLVAATVTTVFGFVIAAIGAWYGGVIDASIQRVTDVVMMIPFLPSILMAGWFVSSDIWFLLVIIIAFRLFSGPLKTYRAMFLQAKNSQFIEAARAYGTSNKRIIFRYLIPQMAPTVLPRLVLGVPVFVFLEATLAILGVSDPDLPTWGKLLSESHDALFKGYYHWVLQPAFLLVITGLSFSTLGYTLDRIFNPRLRDV